MSTPTPLTIARLRQAQLGVLGGAREGLATLRFLTQYLPGQPIVLIDDKPIEQLSQELQTFIARHQQVTFATTTEWSFSHWPIDLLFKTPGIKPDHQLVTAVKQASGQITSQMQLFFDLLHTEELAAGTGTVMTIGITGTKGKSTTTAVIHHVLKSAGLPTVLGGNIGVPALDLWDDINHFRQRYPTTYVALEMSCHQLADLTRSPHLAVVQNIVSEHLDYYPDFATYVQAKTQITRWQTSDDVVIFNPSFATAAQLAHLSPGRWRCFGEVNQLTDGEIVHDLVCWIADGKLWAHNQPVLTLNELPLKGQHNWQNVMPAVVVGTELGLSRDQIAVGLRSFQPLAHRLEPAGMVNGVEYYNDSLSTMPDAAKAALSAFVGRPAILIAGGYERHQDFNDLAQAIIDHPVKALILFKPTGERLWQTVAAKLSDPTTLPHHFVMSMSEAVKLAAGYTLPGDVVLMSPASASFGDFKDYQDRGEQFKAAVKKLG